ncbi:MAG: DNA cytosine methyltransferase [Zetaproteobacteria bacterium]|nr:DNA cytosine methyltransferase [Zetaproteobacteria bacterium]
MNGPIAVELFSGAGGLSIGLKKAGFRIVLANEIEKDFATTFALNHPETKVLCDDIHNINFREEVEKLGESKVDLLSGGPPCQGFSTVGSKNEKDPRNSLFYEYLRAVKELSPSYIIFENVAGFKNMYEGKAYNALISELNDLGYESDSAILEASNFGLPQIRKRTIIVGWKKGRSPVFLPVPTHSLSENLFGLKDKLTLMDAISDLPELSENDSTTSYYLPPQNYYQDEMRKGVQKEELTEHNSSNYGSKMLEILSLIPDGGSVNDLPERLRPKKYFSNTYARLLPNQPAPTITRNFGTPSSSRCVHPYQNRALSTREGARLQGFPDSYIFYGSKTSKNLQIGNAVPPVFGRVIAESIIETIKNEKANKYLHMDTHSALYQARP